LQTWNGSDWVTATTFTQVQLLAGQVSFVQDGSENATASFAVNFSDGALTSANSTFNITTTLLNDVGTTANTADFLVSTSNSGHQYSAQITSLSNGGFAVTWQDDSSGNFDIRGRVFNVSSMKRKSENAD
jgi:hypothetical protein